MFATKKGKKMTKKKFVSACERGAGGWWIARIGEAWIDSAVLRSAMDERSLLRWDGVLGRFKTKREATEAIRQNMEAIRQNMEMEAEEKEVS